VQQHCVRCVKVDREHVPRTHLKTWEGSHRKLLQKNVLSGAIFLLLLLLPRLKDLLGRVGWGWGIRTIILPHHQPSLFPDITLVIPAFSTLYYKL
jgi:hypothetical protein